MQNKKLSSRSEKLLMKYFDGECGPLESLFAARIAKNHPATPQFKNDLESCSSITKSVYASSPREEIDLWNGISREISKAERLGVDKNSSSLNESWDRLSVWFSRLGWGVSGALVTASVGVIMLRSGYSPIGNSAQPLRPLMTTSSNAPSNSAPVTNASFGAPTAIPLRSALNDGGLEIDWLRSSGQLRVIQDPRQRSTILWVQRNRALSQARKPLQLERGNTQADHSVQ